MEGVGLFETIRFEQRRALFVELHEARLRAAWPDLFDAPVPALARGVASAVAAAPAPRGLLRLDFTRAGRDGAKRSATVRPLPPLRQRVKVAVASAPRSEPPAERRRKGPDRRWVDALADRGAFETLVWDDEHGLLEGTRTNLFVVVDGSLVTPPVRCGLVPGVVRAAVLSAAPALGWRVVERPVVPGDLQGSAGLLLTGVGVGVASVAECDGRPLELAASEPLARRLWQAVRGSARAPAPRNWTDRPAR
jgi:branched-subunit amino acid aminotransferase/4-amino-4-deoxychorismate lyase